MIQEILSARGISAVILDMDDTLFLERDYVKSGFMAVGRALGNAAFGDRCWQLFLEGVRGCTFDRALSDFPEIRTSSAEMVSIYRAHAPQIDLCPDARSFITEAPFRFGVISDGPLQSQRAKFRALGIHPWIEIPIFTAEMGISKPAPAAYQLAAYALNLPYERCAYIGDNPRKDFAGAHALGMTSIRIRRTQSLHYAEDSGEDADFETETM